MHPREGHISGSGAGDDSGSAQLTDLGQAQRWYVAGAVAHHVGAVVGVIGGSLQDLRIGQPGDQLTAATANGASMGSLNSCLSLSLRRTAAN